MRRIGAAASASAAALLFPALAMAAPVFCGARNDVLTKLASDFREQPASVALTSDGQLLEVLSPGNRRRDDDVAGVRSRRQRTEIPRHAAAGLAGQELRQRPVGLAT